MRSRTIFITGANGGLGQAIARGFLREPGEGRLILAVHNRRDRVDQLANEFPGRCHAVALDVVSPASWKLAVEQTLALTGGIDVLVNNAGKHADGLLATMPAGDWDEVLGSNLDGAFHGCQAVLPTMIGQRGGRIVNISSLSALMPNAGQANYAAAKAGLIGMTRSLAKEVARMNITVNAVCPGFVETEALAYLAGEARTEAQRRVPMRRFGRPEEVAAAVVFLACADASYITGSVLKVDGGIF